MTRRDYAASAHSCARLTVLSFCAYAGACKEVYWREAIKLVKAACVRILSVTCGEWRHPLYVSVTNTPRSQQPPINTTPNPGSPYFQSRFTESIDGKTPALLGAKSRFQIRVVIPRYRNAPDTFLRYLLHYYGGLHSRSNYARHVVLLFDFDVRWREMLISIRYPV